MKNKLSIELLEYLMLCGLTERQISKCEGSTRMYHDLGIYGDVAEADVEILVNHYGVDLRNFNFEKFFPPEFPGKSLLSRTLFWLIPFANKISRANKKYEPLTLMMVEEAIRDKAWKIN